MIICCLLSNVHHTDHGLFADDTTLWTSSNSTSNLNSRLQQSIDEFQKWCNSWNGDYNQQKRN